MRDYWCYTAVVGAREERGALFVRSLFCAMRFPLLLLVFAAAQPALAHPIPEDVHNRTILVRLTPEAVQVEFTLEVHPFTAILKDLPQIALSKLSKDDEFYSAFARQFGPVLASRLSVSLDGKPLTLACTAHRYELVGEDSKNHLRCDYVFRASWKTMPETRHTFEVRETGFKDDRGTIKITLLGGSGVRRLPSEKPDEELSAEERARVARTDFKLADTEAEALPEEEPPETSGVGGGDTSLSRLLNSQHGLFWLLLLSAVLGAAHALTPGHGKTLVAAYLVGQRGTVAHAFVLGLTTTLTHTGTVLVLALGLRLAFPEGATAAERTSIQQALELGGGLLIAGLGFWLLMRRLTGRSDHIHLGAGPHHHHHGHDHHHHHHHDHPHPHDHHHDHDHDPSHPVQGGWWGLVVLGISGGIIPCWDAVALLVAAVAMNLFWWALPMLLAFSAGLASVLILIGILVVRTRALAGQRWERSRLFRALPLVSAAVVTCLGLWLCYKSLHSSPPSAPTAAERR